MMLRVCVMVAAAAAALGAVLGAALGAGARDELVAAIRRDLQHDNDDYAAPPRPAAPGLFIPLTDLPSLSPIEDTPLPSLRRVLDNNRTSAKNATASEPTKTSTTPDVVKVTSWYTSFTAPRKKKAKTTTATTTKWASELPERVFRANDIGAPEKPAAGKAVTKKEVENEEYFKRELGSLLKVAQQQGAAPVLRARGMRARGMRARGPRGAHRARLPPADALDMAPARGARVHSKRLRHRLCSRYVLNPEGPKYDSRGQIYLNRFTPRGRGNFDFHQTRAPRLLLPRCCNCCRKSVLGCE